MIRKTKIVCTLGPKSEDEQTLRKMIEAGMNVVRLNMSHGEIDQKRPIVNLIKRLRSELGVPLAILVDTKGPEVRLGTFSDGSVVIEDGQRFCLTTDANVECTKDIATVNYDGLHNDVKRGSKILLNDGLVELLVENVYDRNIECKVISGGKLGSRKSLFLPGVKLSLPFLSEADKADLKFACEIDAEFVAASFVSSKEDVYALRNFLRSNGGGGIDIISKIESATGVENIDEIIDASDAIMVARGDLGVELSIERLPAIQKSLIKKAKSKGIIVITATEMLESMTEKLRPTRAETTDVANAVYDETSAVMLSGETAVGINPPHVVKTMANICLAAEETCCLKTNFNTMEFKVKNVADAISHNACSCAFDLKSSAICVLTLGGTTARMISCFRPLAPILAVTPNTRTYNKLALSWGVVPENTNIFQTTEEMFSEARKLVLKNGLAKEGDNFIISAGGMLGKSGGTDLIKVEEI